MNDHTVTHLLYVYFAKTFVAHCMARRTLYLWVRHRMYEINNFMNLADLLKCLFINLTTSNDDWLSEIDDERRLNVFGLNMFGLV